MKKFKEFIVEQKKLSADYIESNSVKEVEDFKKELKNILGSKIAVTLDTEIPPSRSIAIRIGDFDSPLFIIFFVKLGERKSDLETISIESDSRSLNRIGMKYTTITSNKSLKDALNKLLSWFKKNKSKFNKLSEDILSEENVLGTSPSLDMVKDLLAKFWHGKKVDYEFKKISDVPEEYAILIKGKENPDTKVQKKGKRYRFMTR